MYWRFGGHLWALSLSKKRKQDKRTKLESQPQKEVIYPKKLKNHRRKLEKQGKGGEVSMLVFNEKGGKSFSSKMSKLVFSSSFEGRNRKREV